MGKILQVRLSVSTWDEAGVARRWPRLCALAWPEPAGEPIAGFAPPARGVRELADALRDSARFGDWPQKSKDALAADVETLAQVQTKLAAALADWDARAANRLTEDLESALDRAEENVRT